MNLGERIKEQRIKKHLSKAALALLVNVSGTAIGQYEKGDNKPKTEVLLQLCKVLEYDFVNDSPHTGKESPVNTYEDTNENSNNNVAEDKQTYNLEKGIPIYNFPGSASNIEMYADMNDLKVIGTLNVPGVTKTSFAIPVHGHSMYPTLANGNIAILRPIEERQDIEWGSIYYIEYGSYRVFKRLLKDDESPEDVVLWSDNQTETLGGRPKYASKTIKAERIRRLCLLTDILQKPNY